MFTRSCVHTSVSTDTAAVFKHGSQPPRPPAAPRTQGLTPKTPNRVGLALQPAVREAGLAHSSTAPGQLQRTKPGRHLEDVFVPRSSICPPLLSRESAVADYFTVSFLRHWLGLAFWGGFFFAVVNQTIPFRSDNSLLSSLTALPLLPLFCPPALGN